MGIVAWDTETRGLSWWLPEEQAFLVTWADEMGEWHADLSDKDSAEVRRFVEAVKNADAVVGHNGKFDTHMIRETLGLDIAALGIPIYDTELMSRVLHPEGQNKGTRSGHGLKNLATVYLRVDAKDPEEAIKEMAKSIGLRTIKRTGAYYEVYRAYPNEMITYAVADARYTRDLYTEFSAQFEKDDAARRVYELERKVQPIIIEAERVGIRTDQDRVAEFKRKFTDDRNTHYESLVNQLGEKAMTPKTGWEDGWAEDDESADLAEALLKLGVPLYERTRTGRISTNKFALQEFEHDFPVIAELFEFRRLERFLSTYIGPMDGVEVVHPNFGQIGAWTGRMSCRQPNLQNLPKRAGKEVRSVFVPRPGYAFVVCDYESIEIRLLAYYLGDDDFRRMIDEGHDAHAWMAANIWGGEPSMYAKGTPGEAKRNLAKNVLFAITYGAGRRRVGRMLRDADMHASDESAAEIIRKIKSSLPNYYHLTKHRVEPKIKAVGHINTILGRRNPVKKDRAYVGLNALVQGSAADVFKLGVVGVNEAVKPLGGLPLLFVHDECVVEVSIDRAEECLELTKRAMVSAYDLNPKLSVEGSITTTSYADA